VAEADKAINVANFLFTSQLLQKKLDDRFSLLSSFITTRSLSFILFAPLQQSHLYQHIVYIDDYFNVNRYVG
jgi:hypothetical protein